MKSCCVTGHRPKGFCWDYYDKECPAQIDYLDSLRDNITELVGKGYTHFISGGAVGVDMDFAEAVLELRDSIHPDITLEIAVPCEGQDKSWIMADVMRYQRILKEASSVTYISKNYTRWCMQKRNEYMVDNSDLVLGFWSGIEKGGTYNTIAYAREQDKEVNIIFLKCFIF